MISSCWFLLLPLCLAFTCQVTHPVGKWLEEHHLHKTCDTVKGHFVLDATANRHVVRLYSVFGNIQRIEGCIKIYGFTAASNLSIFNRLKEVVCDEKEAAQFGLHNVIYVRDGFFKKMGFNSLKRVEGPGEIVISYEEELDFVSYWEPDRSTDHCFTPEEISFLVFHPQFTGKMYKPSDPCFSMDRQGLNEFWTIDELPKNCSVLAGNLYILGPYPPDYKSFSKLHNLQAIIGYLTIEGTFLTSLDILNNLQVIYTRNRETYGQVIQLLNIGYNKFIQNYSLPSLQPIKNLTIQRSSIIRWSKAYSSYFKLRNFLFQEPILNPCQYFPQFGYPYSCVEEEFDRLFKTDQSNRRVGHFEWKIWLISIMWTTFGLFLSFRSIFILLFGINQNSFPRSRVLLALSIFIFSLVALQSSLAYEKFNLILTNSGSLDENEIYRPYFLPEINGVALYNGLQFFLRLITAFKYAIQPVIVLFYGDMIYFFFAKFSTTPSIYFPIFASHFYKFTFFFFICLTIHLHLNLYSFATIGYIDLTNWQAGAPYTKYWPLVIDSSAAESASLLMENELLSTYYLPQGVQYTNAMQRDFMIINGLENLRPEILGVEYSKYPIDLQLVFPDLTFFCDGAMFMLFIATITLKVTKTVRIRWNFCVVFLLYIQLSMNRIRWFIFRTILLDDYCIHFNGPPVDDCSIAFNENMPVIYKLIEKLPYFSFTLVALFCSKSAIFYQYWGAILDLQQKRKQSMVLNTPSSVIISKK